MGNTKASIKRIVISKIRNFSHKRYTKFEHELENLSEEALYQFNRFLQDLEYKINQLERKARRRF